MKTCQKLVVLGLCVFISVSAFAGDFKLPVGPTFISGHLKVVALYEDNSGGESTFAVPIGVSFHPYYQFDFGFRLGGGIGPVSAILGDLTYYNVPLNIHVGFSFIPRANASPYIKTGAMFHLGGGDYVEGRNLGIFAAFGMEFNRKRMIGFGFEIAYETASVTFDDYSVAARTSDIKPNGLMISGFVIF